MILKSHSIACISNSLCEWQSTLPISQPNAGRRCHSRKFSQDSVATPDSKFDSFAAQRSLLFLQLDTRGRRVLLHIALSALIPFPPSLPPTRQGLSQLKREVFGRVVGDACRFTVLLSFDQSTGNGVRTTSRKKGEAVCATQKGSRLKSSLHHRQTSRTRLLAKQQTPSTREYTSERIENWFWPFFASFFFGESCIPFIQPLVIHSIATLHHASIHIADLHLPFSPLVSINPLPFT